MRYTNGNYEAFARPRKPKGVDDKSAYIVGGGLAGLATAVFLIRDGQMKGENIHIFEELTLSGGSLDGKFIPHDGFVTRGTRNGKPFRVFVGSISFGTIIRSRRCLCPR